MRRDPIISEDWKIGTTTYFQYNYLKYIDVVLSSFMIIIGIYISYYSGFLQFQLRISLKYLLNKKIDL